MDRIPVKSSNIKAIGWEPETKELEVEFLPHKDGEPGRCYRYQNVEYEQYRDFLNAESVGHHFAVNIRACFEGRRIDSPKEKKDAKPK